jgi:phytoene synthase
MPDGAVVRGEGAPVTGRVREGVAPGSLRYLAVLFSGSPERPLLEAVYAFEAELRRITASASHEAAHARLQWWRGELDRLAAGRPSHPLATALLPLNGRRDVGPALLHEMLVAADLDLAGLTYLSWQELDAYLFRSAGAAQTLLAAILAGDRGLSPTEREFARRLGAAVRQSEMLFELGRDMARGRLYAPLQALESAGIDPTALAGDSTYWRSDASAAFITAWRDRIQSELQALPALLEEPGRRAAQRHGLVLAALHGRWLHCLPDTPGVQRQLTELGQISRLWTAWRTAMRCS